jgi:hypothetical protein
MHVERLLASATGDEITTCDWGIFGAFPMPSEMAATGHGAIPVKDLTPTDIFATVRKTAPDALIDVHHPRLEKAIGYFYLGGFENVTVAVKEPTSAPPEPLKVNDPPDEGIPPAARIAEE